MTSDELNGTHRDVKPQVIIPKCGHCGSRGAQGGGAPLAITNIQMGPAMCVVIVCGNPECGVIHNVQVMEVAVPQQPQSMIVPPSGRM